MGKFVKDRYWAEFEIDKSPQEVWSVLNAGVGEEPAWMACWPQFPGSDRAGTVTETDPPKWIRVRKNAQPCKDTLIELSLDSVDAGTRVTVTQADLPEWATLSVDSFVLGGDQITADLVLLLERGIQMSRHSLPWSFAGLAVREVNTGLEVTGVMPGAFADRTGIRANDLLMTFGGAPVFTQHCLQAMQRVFKTGEEVTLTWVRERELCTGSGVL